MRKSDMTGRREFLMLLAAATAAAVPQVLVSAAPAVAQGRAKSAPSLKFLTRAEFATLDEIEFKPKAVRRAMRADGSALSVAYSDPVLRADGMASDRLGDATAFFDLSDQDAHIVLCSCHGGATMRADEAARRVRGIRSPSLWPLYFGWFW